MNIREIIFVFLMIALGAPASAQTASDSSIQDLDPDTDPMCNPAKDQISMNYCSDARFENADKKLNQIYNRLMKEQSNNKKLRDAQRAWVLFRNKDCKYFVDDNEGTAGPLFWNDCMQDLTEKRIADLKRYEEIFCAHEECGKK